MYYFLYKVEYYDEFEKGMSFDSGMVVGESLLEALEKVSHYYGESSIEEVSLKYFSGDRTVLSNEDYPEFIEAAFKEREKYYG